MFGWRDKMNYIIALDEGTTSTRAVLYNLETQKIERIKSMQINQIYPKPSYVEQSALEIYSSSLAALVEVIDSVGAEKVLGIGITNQRETVIAWEKNSGKPLYNAIIWQCRRTAGYCKQIEEQYGELIKSKTGLKVDPYFSASKIRWLLDNSSEVQKALSENNLCFGTVETYLVYRLTGGKSFVTDYTNASRTMLFNIDTLCWDKDLLQIFGIPESALPKVVSPDEVVGEFVYQGKAIKIAGLAGDQQSAMVGQGCFERGSAKITYGTGLFMLANLGKERKNSEKGLVTTLGYGKTPAYMFEGSVFNAGSAVQWLRDELDFFEKSETSEKLAISVPDSNGVYVVPAFTGLGAPYWVSEATGLITGITRGVNKAHITRAVLESMAYSAKDLCDVMVSEGGITLSEIRVDGGASKNNFLMQFQSDILNIAVDRPIERESTALGAVYLCEIALGLKTIEQICESRKSEQRFLPSDERQKYNRLYSGWLEAVTRCIYDKK